MTPAELVARRRRPIRVLGATTIAVWCAALFGWYLFLPMLKDDVRSYAIDVLQAQFGCRARVDSFDVRFTPRLRVIAYGVHIGDDSSGSLIDIGMADAESSLVPWHIRSLVVEGFSAHIPTTEIETIGKPVPGLPLTIDDMVANRGQVEILPTVGQSAPIAFNIARLHIQNFQPGRPALFSAVVLVSQPLGEIDADGHFGPWSAQQPSLTPLQGTYRVSGCDLSSLSGLKGELSSQGRFQGDLKRLEVAGALDAAKFGLSTGGRQEAAHANFQMLLDASDGSVAVKHIDGELQRTSFIASGKVENVEDERQRNIDFDLSVGDGRLEDVLPVAVKPERSPISGDLRLRAKLQVSPGDGDILDRLWLDGGFVSRNARFASLDLREELSKLNRKTSRHSKQEAPSSPIFRMQGRLQLHHSVGNFSNLSIALENASARLDGTYRLTDQRLDFDGELWLPVKLSKSVGGLKALLLKPVDPFFRSKRGGSRIPIKITGTQSDPHFELRLAKKRHGARSRVARVVFSH